MSREPVLVMGWYSFAHILNFLPENWQLVWVQLLFPMYTESISLSIEQTKTQKYYNNFCKRKATCKYDAYGF